MDTVAPPGGSTDTACSTWLSFIKYFFNFLLKCSSGIHMWIQPHHINFNLSDYHGTDTHTNAMLNQYDTHMTHPSLGKGFIWKCFYLREGFYLGERILSGRSILYRKSGKRVFIWEKGIYLREGFCLEGLRRDLPGRGVLSRKLGQFFL